MEIVGTGLGKIVAELVLKLVELSADFEDFPSAELFCWQSSKTVISSSLMLMWTRSMNVRLSTSTRRNDHVVEASACAVQERACQQC